MLSQLDFAPLDQLPGSPMAWIAGAVAAVVILAILWKLTRRKPTTAKRIGGLELDLASLGENGPPEEGPLVQCHHVPVRVALIVFAPLGRSSTLTVTDGLTGLADELCHGLGAAVETHRPKMTLWPPQLASSGFSSLFFGKLKLPGKRGKGTPWCAMSGRCQLNGQNMMVGMAFRAGEPNSLGEILLESEYAWREALKIDAS